MIFGCVAGYASLMDRLGLESCLGAKGREVYDDLSGIDLLVLFGGEDISPSMYGQKPVATTAGKIPSVRDAVERVIFLSAIEQGVPVLGICRGAQLACVLLGGKLWQDVDNHEGREHPLIIGDKEYKTNSYHHQMMIPTEEMEIIGYTPCLSPFKMGETPANDEGDEPEIVFHRQKKVLMVQGHPEWESEEHDLSKLTRYFVRELLCNGRN